MSDKVTSIGNRMSEARRSEIYFSNTTGKEVQASQALLGFADWLERMTDDMPEWQREEILWGVGWVRSQATRL